MELYSDELELTYKELDKFFNNHIVEEMRTYQTINTILLNYLERLKQKPIYLQRESTPKDA